MYIDYKVKKYNFKIIETIKNNNIKKIPDYLSHLYFYLKKNINNNLIVENLVQILMQILI